MQMWWKCRPMGGPLPWMHCKPENSAEQWMQRLHFWHTQTHLTNLQNPLRDTIRKGCPQHSQIPPTAQTIWPHSTALPPNSRRLYSSTLPNTLHQISYVRLLLSMNQTCVSVRAKGRSVHVELGLGESTISIPRLSLPGWCHPRNQPLQLRLHLHSHHNWFLWGNGQYFQSLVRWQQPLAPTKFWQRPAKICRYQQGIQFQ